MSEGRNTAVGAVILREIGVDMIGRLTLVAVDGGGSRGWGVQDDDRSRSRSGFHNHNQSSRQSSASSTHSWSSSMSNLSPAMLCQSCIPLIVLPSRDA